MHNVKFHNFQAKEKHIKKLEKNLRNIQKLLPWNSSIHACITKNDGAKKYLFNLDVQSSAGNFNANAKGSSIKSAYKKIFLLILKQVESWHKDRFADQHDGYPDTIKNYSINSILDCEVATCPLHKTT